MKDEHVEAIVGAISTLTNEVRELGDTIHEVGRGLGAIHAGDDVAVSPGVLTSIAGSLERIAASLDVLAGKAEYRVRRIP